jgi:hypothetical protein
LLIALTVSFIEQINNSQANIFWHRSEHFENQTPTLREIQISNSRRECERSKSRFHFLRLALRNCNIAAAVQKPICVVASVAPVGAGEGGVINLITTQPQPPRRRRQQQNSLSAAHVY